MAAAKSSRASRGAFGKLIGPAAMVEQAGLRLRVEVGSQLDGMGVVGDRAGVVLPIDPGQAADLEDFDRRLLASQIGIARVDHLVVPLQRHQ